MNNEAKQLLTTRLRHLGHTDPLVTPDDYRSAILGLLASEAVAARYQGIVYKYRGLFNVAFGQKLETREHREYGHTQRERRERIKPP